MNKAKQLSENIKDLLHYYEIFLAVGECRAVKSRKLLKDSAKLINDIEDDVWDKLVELGNYDEARELRPGKKIK
jgi:dihydroneopterin aldolase